VQHLPALLELFLSWPPLHPIGAGKSNAGTLRRGAKTKAAGSIPGRRLSRRLVFGSSMAGEDPFRLLERSDARPLAVGADRAHVGITPTGVEIFTLPPKDLGKPPYAAL